MSKNQSLVIETYLSLEERVSAKHPLRKLRAVVDALLASMSSEFDAAYLLSPSTTSCQPLSISAITESFKK